MTKKILALVLAMAMVFAFAACGSKDKSSSDSKDTGIVGEWTLTSAEAAGQKITGDALKSFDFSWKFEDGGKASINAMGQTAETTYTFENDTITFADETASAFTLKKEGSKLVMDYSGTTLYFEKK